MDLWRSATVLRRRWYVVLVVLLVAAATSGRVLSPAPTFEATAQVLLRPVEVPGQNYLGRLGPDLMVASTVVARALVADGYGGRLGVSNDGVVYQVAVQAPGATLQRSGFIVGPVLDVRVLSAEPAVAAQTLNELLRGITAQLTSRQSATNLPPDRRIEASVLSRTDTPGALPLSRSRAVVALGLLTLLAILGLAAALQSWEGRVARRREGSRSQPASGQPHLEREPQPW